MILKYIDTGFYWLPQDVLTLFTVTAISKYIGSGFYFETLYFTRGSCNKYPFFSFIYDFILFSYKIIIFWVLLEARQLLYDNIIFNLDYLRMEINMLNKKKLFTGLSIYFYTFIHIFLPL